MKYISILILIFFTSQNLLAITNYVSKTGGHISPFNSWANAATNIQAAVDVASSNDMVLVNDGTYYPSDQITVTNDMIVKSVSGPIATIVDGSFLPQSNRIFYVNNGDTINGLTILNGYRGVYCYEGGTVLNCIINRNSNYGILCNAKLSVPTNFIGGTVLNCIISDNSGCGIFCGRNSVIQDCIISNNLGGGMICYYGTVENCIISANSGHNGGVWCYCNSVIQKCTISGNSAHNGGGIYCEGKSVVQNCIISGNSAYYGGGGIYCDNNSVVQNCIISGNSTRYYGGGVYCENGGTIQNSIISKNSGFGSFSIGGGVYCKNGTIQNCTISGNSAKFSGGIIGLSNANVLNSIIYFNYALAAANYCIDIPSVFEYNCTTPLADGIGNIADDPKLLDNGHIATNSPCVNEGNIGYTSGADIDNELWQNPPAIGCDQPVSGICTGKLTVSIFANHNKIVTGYSNYFYSTISGRASRNCWSFDNGDNWDNTLGGYHSWNSPGTYKVIITAYNDTYPAGVSATVVVEVVEKQIHYVSINGGHILPFTSWGTAATNIQAAINVASAGDTILVNDGTYYSDSAISVMKSINIESINGAKKTIVDGNNINSCFLISSGDIIEGFTITNGNAIGGRQFGNYGGGVYCDGNGTIINCNITRNTAGFKGGGIYFRNGGMVINTSINGNFAKTGGGVWGAYGAVVQNCTISGNSVSSDGGGINCSGNGIIQNCIINGNFAFDDGGGIDFSGDVIKNCIINGNIASNSGGGVIVQYSMIKNCTVISNFANTGGGVYCYKKGVVDNCTISKNSAYSNGGGIYCNYDGIIQNSILWNNICSNYFYYSSINAYNCIENWTNLVNGIITNNPDFRNAESGDYRLESYSPCINAGTNMDWMWSATDLDGNPRITDGIVDMGAYEYIPEPYFLMVYYLSFVIYYLRK